MQRDAHSRRRYRFRSFVMTPAEEFLGIELTELADKLVHATNLLLGLFSLAWLGWQSRPSSSFTLGFGLSISGLITLLSVLYLLGLLYWIWPTLMTELLLRLLAIDRNRSRPWWSRFAKQR